MMIAPNTPIFAARPNISVYASPEKRANRYQFASDEKSVSRDWKTNDQIGYVTGTTKTTNEGIWVEVVIRQWTQQKISKNVPKALWFVPGVNVVTGIVTNSASDWVRVDVIGYVREGDYYSNDVRETYQKAAIEKKVADASGALPEEYRPVSIFQNDEGIWSVKLPNGYVTTVAKYEGVSLIERKNLALSITGPKTETPPPSPETPQSLPTWAVALIVGGGVMLLGVITFTLLKPKKNGTRKR